MKGGSEKSDAVWETYYRGMVWYQPYVLRLGEELPTDLCHLRCGMALLPTYEVAAAALMPIRTDSFRATEPEIRCKLFT